MRLNYLDIQRRVPVWLGGFGLAALIAVLLFPTYPASAAAGAAVQSAPQGQRSGATARPAGISGSSSGLEDRRVPVPATDIQDDTTYQQTVIPGLCTTFNFESGDGGFTVQPVTGATLWHVDDNLCRANLTGHTTTHTFYYGQDMTCNYNTGSQNASNLLSPTINFASPSRVMLSFNYLLFVESSGSFDTTFIDISTNGGTSWTPLLSKANLINDNQWHTICSDVSASIGLASSLRVRFRFDSVDSLVNSSTGWHVDDISVCATPTIQDNTNGNCLSIDLCGNTYLWHTPASGDLTGPIVITQNGSTINFSSGPGDANALRGGIDSRGVANARIVAPGNLIFSIADSNIFNNTTCP